MPTYEFRCSKCLAQKETVLKIKDVGVPVLCDSCNQTMERIFSTPGIIFNGSGFYRTDNRK